MHSPQQPEKINIQGVSWDTTDPQEGGGAYEVHVTGEIDFTGDEAGPVFVLTGSFSADEIEESGAGVLQSLVNALEDEGHTVATVEVTYTIVVTNAGTSGVEEDQFQFHLTATLENGATTEISLDEDDVPEGTQILGFAPWTTFDHILALFDEDAASVSGEDALLI